ncbi:MAG TPA: hypothetical protein VGK00_16120 [Anaerolineales bacterium]|jgi:hypothetical protein
MPETKTYTPELLSRQGELTAWALAVAAGLGLYFLSLRAPLPFWAWFLFAIFAFSAVSISLGNWMDRKTRISLSETGVLFENGLRKAALPWDAVREVRTAPARWGLSVQVIGDQAHFSFSTLGEMRFQGQVRGRTGFTQGQQIMDEIIRSSNLTQVTRDGQFLSYTRSI